MKDGREENGKLKNGNGTKAFGGVIAIVALITGVMAIVRPMQQSIDAQKADLLRHQVLPSHPEALEDLAQIREKFVEVETQFKNLDERTSRMETATAKDMESLEHHIQLELNLKIDVLNKEIEWLRSELSRLGGKHP